MLGLGDGRATPSADHGDSQVALGFSNAVTSLSGAVVPFAKYNTSAAAPRSANGA